MNQPIHNSHLKEPIYENLKNAHKKILVNPILELGYTYISYISRPKKNFTFK